MGIQPQYDAIVLGAGPAGFTAGIYLAQFKFKTLLLESMTEYPAGPLEIPPGRSSVSGFYFNVPGFPDGISREDLKWRGIEQAKHAGCEYRIDEAYAINKDHTYYTVRCRTREISTTAIFLAMGVKDVWPDLPGVHSYVGRSLFFSVTLSGRAADGKVAAIIGNDDHAAMEALRLTDYASQVYLLTHDAPLHLSEEMKAVLAQLNIPIIQSRIKTVEEEEEGIIHGVILENNQEIPVRFLFFPSQERHPRSNLAEDAGVHVDVAGFIHVNERFETNLPNIYAIGDITARGPEQVITSYYHGMQAAWAFYEERFQKKLHQVLSALPPQVRSKR